MPSHVHAVVAPMLAHVLLVFIMSGRLLYVRVTEMRRKRIHPQALATSAGMATRLEDLRAADNFRNLFEVPVLFFALMIAALATAHAPGWPIAGAWAFVALRALHSLIHCGYNKVLHRFAVFLTSCAVLLGLWIAFFLTLPGPAAA